MNSNEIIKDAWRTTRKNQKLVWLGLLAVIPILINLSFGFAVSAAQYGVQTVFGAGDITTIMQFGVVSTPGEFLQRYPIWLIGLAVLLSLLTIVIGSFSDPAILNGLLMIRHDEYPAYKTIFIRTVKKIAPIILFTILTSAVSRTSTFLEWLIRLQESFLFNVSFCGINLIITLGIYFVSFYVPFVIVVEDLNLIAAIKHTWSKIFKPHLSSAIGMYIVINLIGGGILLATALPCYMVAFFLFRPEHINNVFSILLFLLILVPIPTIGFGFSSTFTNAALLSFYDQIKAIDKAKEEAEAFDGEVEVEAEEPDGDEE